MKRPLSILGCGLLVLALSSFSVGCKSKKSSPGDGGTDSGAGTGGGGSSGKGGTGGTSGKGGGSGGGGGGGATLTMAECTTMTMAAGLQGNTMTCSTCACSKNLAQASACVKDANCWKLIQCAVGKCPKMPSDATCLTTNCSAYLGGATPATALGMTLTSMCGAECPPPAPSTDGGSGDAGH